MSKNNSKSEKIILFQSGDIEEMRLRSGLSKQEFADKLKISTRTLYEWISGNSSPSAKHIPKLIQFRKEAFGNVQNINGTNAQGTQIIGDGQTTHNNGQSCEDTKEQTSNTGKLLDAHVSLMEQMRQLIEVVKSQQETISHLVVHKK